MAARGIALITGGCRRLGAVIAGRLAEAGWSLALHAQHDAEPEGDLLARLNQSGTDWHGFTADLSVASEVETLVARVRDHFGAAPSLLVNNASRFGQEDIWQATMETLDQHMTINATAPMVLARDVAASATVDAPAIVINLLDQRIRHPGGDQTSYTASKLALAASIEMLARALAPKARVCGVAPGLTIPTEAYLPRQLAALAEAMPLGLLPEPDDIADAVLYLADARATTGQILYVDGGANLQDFGRDFLYLARD